MRHLSENEEKLDDSIIRGVETPIECWGGPSKGAFQCETHDLATKSVSGSIVMPVTALTREEIFRSQRDAALRRRKQQFQSDFIGGASRRRIPGSQRFTPSVKKISSSGDDWQDPIVEALVVEQAPNNTSQENFSYDRSKPLHQRFNYNSPRTRKYDGRHSMIGLQHESEFTRTDETHARTENRENNLQLPEMIEIAYDKSYADSTEVHEKIMKKAGYSDNENSHIRRKEFDDQTVLSDLTDNKGGEARRSREKGGGRSFVRSPSTLAHIMLLDSKNRQEVGRSANDNKMPKENVPSLDEHADDEDTEREKGPMVPTQEITEKQEGFSHKIDWENLKEVKKVLMEPVPKSAGMVQCYIRRNKGKSRFYPEYRAYLKDGDRFLMTSKKRKKKKTSNYLISIGRNDHNKGSDKIIGKLRSNFMGTEFQIYDEGKNPKDLDPFFDERNEDPVRRELGAILYGNNVGSTRGPRKMQVCINKVSGNSDHAKQFQPVHKDESMLSCFKKKSESAKCHLMFFENRQPKWNEDICAYVLNFNKRVTMASVKNFQLIIDHTNSDNEVTMQFGRSGNDEFIMDVKWPMSLFQAFAIALSSCDSKLACD